LENEYIVKVGELKINSRSHQNNDKV